MYQKMIINSCQTDHMSPNPDEEREVRVRRHTFSLTIDQKSQALAANIFLKLTLLLKLTQIQHWYITLMNTTEPIFVQHL